MSVARPVSGCHDLTFGSAYVVDDSAEVALEDYAREVTRARDVELVRSNDDPARVTGLHLCGLDAVPAPGLRADVEDFARDLDALAGGDGGLGWS